jgi:hypothetical protein
MSEPTPAWKVGDYVRIKAACVFHGMVGEIKYKHGNDYGVYIPWCFTRDLFAGSVQANFRGDQLWPATRTEFYEAVDRHRLQVPQPGQTETETAIYPPPKELTLKLIDQRSNQIRLGLKDGNGNNK